MSRTDKDTPYWTQVPWVADHTIRCNAGRDVCDLAPNPPEHGPVRWNFSRVILRGGGWSDRARCVWESDDRRTYHQQFHHVPKWFRDHRWTNVQRVAVRDTGRRAIAEYRATGDVDVIAPTDQHRHGAAWDWS